MLTCTVPIFLVDEDINGKSKLLSKYNFLHDYFCCLWTLKVSMVYHSHLFFFFMDHKRFKHFLSWVIAATCADASKTGAWQKFSLTVKLGRGVVLYGTGVKISRVTLIVLCNRSYVFQATRTSFAFYECFVLPLRSGKLMFYALCVMGNLSTSHFWSCLYIHSKDSRYFADFSLAFHSSSLTKWKYKSNI